VTPPLQDCSETLHSCHLARACPSGGRFGPRGGRFGPACGRTETCRLEHIHRAHAHGPEGRTVTRCAVRTPVDNPQDPPSCSQAFLDLNIRISSTGHACDRPCEQVVIPALATPPGATADSILTLCVTTDGRSAYIVTGARNPDQNEATSPSRIQRSNSIQAPNSIRFLNSIRRSL
jgi:hypothetical protein